MKPNPNGVYETDPKGMLLYATKLATASIRVLQLKTGWIAAGSYEHLTGTHQGMMTPLVAHRYFPSLETAIRHAAESIIFGQNSVIADTSRGITTNQIAEARLILEWAKAILQNPSIPKPQPRVEQLTMI